MIKRIFSASFTRVMMTALLIGMMAMVPMVAFAGAVGGEPSIVASKAADCPKWRPDCSNNKPSIVASKAADCPKWRPDCS